MASLRESVPLQRLKILKKTLGGGLKVFAGCVLLLLFATPFIFRVLGGLPDYIETIWKYARMGLPAAGILLMCWYAIYQYLYFRHYFYDISDDCLTIRKGVLLRKEMSLPFATITDVWIDRDFLDFLFQTYDVHVSIPTQDSSCFAHIDGVNKEHAIELRKIILDRIQAHSTDRGSLR